jgi:Holliday junction resolvasome RuvABC endonuclease subunit
VPVDNRLLGAECIKLIGIDLSTKKIALAVGVETVEPQFIELTASEARAADRFNPLMDAFRELLRSLKPVARVFIEDISFVRNRRSELDLAQMLGGVKALLTTAGIPYVTVNNMTWKCALGLGGKASKLAIAEYAAERWLPLEIPSQDAADALCVLEWGIIQYRKGTLHGQERATASGRPRRKAKGLGRRRVG